MATWTLILLCLCSSSCLFSKETGMSHAARQLMEASKKESKAFGEESAAHLIKELKKGNPESGALNVSHDDLLPEEDKGRTFDPSYSVEEAELKSFLELSLPREKLEGSEAFFALSSKTTENPKPSLDIEVEKIGSSMTDARYETCLESGSYEIVVEQELHVEFKPAVVQNISHCKGHHDKKAFFWKKDAEAYAKSKEKKLSKDSSIESFKVSMIKGGLFKDFGVESRWQHKETVSCKHSWIEERVVQQASEEERWEAEDPGELALLESSPGCRILYSQVLSGPETRQVQDAPVFRDCWRRRLIFSCGGDPDSKCSRLRDLGATIFRRRCIQFSPFNEAECEVWEKTYRIGNAEISSQVQVEFTGDPIWGLEGSFESAYSSNEDFSPAVATLAVLADVKQEAELSQRDFAHGASIFSGLLLECKRSFAEKALYDCCQKMKGMALSSKLCRCTAEEKDLATKRDEGKCHFVGTYKKHFNTEKVQAFCCFPSKLARIIQEQGRKQLGLGWGSAEHPDCSGLTVDQFKLIDFSRIDLSEAFDEWHLDPHLIRQKVEASAKDLIQSQQGSYSAPPISPPVLEKGGSHG